MFLKSNFYLNEIIFGLETIYKNNMIYRDIKQKNILMDS